MLVFALLAASRVVVTEVMANPAGGTGTLGPEDRNEFVELYNASRYAVDLDNWTIDDGDSKDQLVAWQDPGILDSSPGVIINYTWLAPGCYAVVLDSEYLDPGASGGYVQPYRLPPGTLILTTGNTTIGNGLANTDPVVLASPYGDSSTFGTPADSTDSLPCDAGDGVSWERISHDRPDAVDNWTACIDSSGCTPGAPASINSYIDLAVTGISLGDSALPGVEMRAEAVIANSGYVTAGTWRLDAFLDHNGNARLDPGELVSTLEGWPLEPDADSLLRFTFVCPRRKTDFWVRVELDRDRDSTNNSVRVTVSPGGADRLLVLDRSSFSPDGDGIEDTLTVYYRLPATGGRLSAVVYDLAGRPVRTLCRSLIPDDERGFLCWDGRRDNGGRAAIGVYAVWLELKQGGSTRSEKQPVVLVRK